MNRRVILHPRAAQDLEAQADFIARDSLAAAIRFAQAVQEAFRQLAQMPQMGRERRFPNPLLEGMRQWRVPGFEKHLIFYRPIEDGIEVLRVLHGARDIDRLFREDEAEGKGEP